MDAELTSWS